MSKYYIHNFDTGDAAFSESYEDANKEAKRLIADAFDSETLRSSCIIYEGTARVKGSRSAISFVSEEIK